MVTNHAKSIGAEERKTRKILYPLRQSNFVYSAWFAIEKEFDTSLNPLTV